MKRLLIIAMLAYMGTPIAAQYGLNRESSLAKLIKGKNKNAGSRPFENGGYDLRGCKPPYFSQCRLEKFAESDTLAYLMFQEESMKENEFYFMFLTVKEATVVIDSVLVKSKERKRGQRLMWFKSFLENTGIRFDIYNKVTSHAQKDLKQLFDNDKYWTFFKAQKVPNGRPHTSLDYFKYENLTLKKAVTAYLYQRGYDEKGNKRKNLTSEDWMALFKALKVVLPLMPDGDSRNMYDQLTDPNGTRK